MSNSYNYRLPVKQEPARHPAPLWQQAAPVVVRGAALVAAGVIGEWLLRSAARKATGIPFSGRKSRAVAAREPVIEAFQETIVVRRTVVRQK
ncbi:MAG TPA: hypothetical protein VMT90_10375 [Dehalococcoidia bacterium]|jgi:hypothetical protein|nr:hypothetical protein [Dehalococcoidia bacterium]